MYLGRTIYSSGRVANELTRKLGAAWADFQKLRKSWNHSSLSKTRKLEVYQAAVVSSLLYGMGSAWLNALQIRRLNRFQARSLGRILRIMPPFISRVSKVQVLEAGGQPPLSHAEPPTLGTATLIVWPGGQIASELPLAKPADKYIRRRGCPRNE